MRIAMFGGSFNPIHNGHIELVQAFVRELSLDSALIVPAFVSPFKLRSRPVSPEQRLEMCRLAFEGMPCAEVSDIEIRREGASYTYLTLEALTEQYRVSKLFLITGADSFLTIHTWKNPEIIFSHAVICGVPRNGDDMKKLEKQADYLHTLHAETRLLNASVMTVSSTEIREKAARGESIRGLVPEAVERYILQNGLYASKDAHNLNDR